jgi:isopropylmalate/homocitrate/citramalate synthase
MSRSTQPCLGRESKIIIDKYTGKSAVASRLEEYGIEVSAAELEVIVTRIKNIGDERKQLFDADILEIAEQVTGREIDVIPRRHQRDVNGRSRVACVHIVGGASFARAYQCLQLFTK